MGDRVLLWLETVGYGSKNRPQAREICKRLPEQTQCQRHPCMIAHDGLGRAPLPKRLAVDLETGEVLWIEATTSHEGPTVAVRSALEPVALDPHQIAPGDKPDLMGSGRAGKRSCRS